MEETATTPAPEEMQQFLDTFMYGPEAFLVDEVTRLDIERREIQAVMDTRRDLPFARQQRTDANNPPHVAVGEILMATGSMGSLHAWFFHGCRWADGWTGFGNRIHRADFKAFALIGPPLEMVSRETRTRAGTRRLVIRYEFEFRQRGTLVYYGDQSAMFFKDSVFARAP